MAQLAVFSSVAANGVANLASCQSCPWSKDVPTPNITQDPCKAQLGQEKFPRFSGVGQGHLHSTKALSRGYICVLCTNRLDSGSVPILIIPFPSFLAFYRSLQCSVSPKPSVSSAFDWDLIILLFSWWFLWIKRTIEFFKHAQLS